MAVCGRHHTRQGPQQLFLPACCFYLYYFGTQVPERSGVPGCPAIVLSFCPCFSNIDSLEPFILNAITFQLKYDVYDVYSVSREKKSFSLLIIVLQSSPCPSQHDFCILCPCVKLSIVFRTQQDERPCFHMGETRF